MIRDAARLERLLADIRRFVREHAVPNEDRVEQEDRIPDGLVAGQHRQTPAALA